MLKKDISQQLQSHCREYFFSQEKNSKLYNIRLGAYELFKINGLPNSKDENWKYTNISQKIDTILSLIHI
mgnify:FL=1